jgi:hypothetical protein
MSISCYQFEPSCIRWTAAAPSTLRLVACRYHVEYGFLLGVLIDNGLLAHHSLVFQFEFYRIFQVLPIASFRYRIWQPPLPLQTRVIALPQQSVHLTVFLFNKKIESILAS